jgi:hypothetical protein
MSAVRMQHVGKEIWNVGHSVNTCQEETATVCDVGLQNVTRDAETEESF